MVLSTELILVDLELAGRICSRAFRDTSCKGLAPTGYLTVIPFLLCSRLALVRQGLRSELKEAGAALEKPECVWRCAEVFLATGWTRLHARDRCFWSTVTLGVYPFSFALVLQGWGW